MPGPTFNAHSVAPYEHAEATSMRREAQGEVYIRENFEFRAGVQSVHTVGGILKYSTVSYNQTVVIGY